MTDCVRVTCILLTYAYIMLLGYLSLMSFAIHVPVWLYLIISVLIVVAIFLVGLCIAEYYDEPDEYDAPPSTETV